MGGILEASMRDIPTTNIDISHHLQRQVLLQLRQQGAQTYAELQPDGVEGNAYNYHLKNLKHAGLIVLKEGRYELTPTGHVVADAFSFQTGRLVLRPHFYTYILVTNGDEVLLYVPTRQPMPNVLCLPSGKLHYGDGFERSIAREMARRQLSDDYTVHHVCPLTVRYVKHGEVILHRPGNIWHVDYQGEKRTSTTESGTADWFKIADVHDRHDVTTEVIEGLDRIKNNSHEPIDATIAL